MSFHLELLTPERKVFEKEINQVSLPTSEGQITILTHHIPLVATLVPGVIRIMHQGVEEEIVVSGGFIYVESGKHMRILADTAERGHELDLSVIEAAKVRAEEVLKQAVHVDSSAYAVAAAALERELARHKVARKYRASRSVPLVEAGAIPSDENPL